MLLEVQDLRYPRDEYLAEFPGSQIASAADFMSIGDNFQTGDDKDDPRCRVLVQEVGANEAL